MPIGLFISRSGIPGETAVLGTALLPFRGFQHLRGAPESIDSTWLFYGERGEENRHQAILAHGNP
jgi:hypothetical protein